MNEKNDQESAELPYFYNHEDVYDNEIKPLVDKIIATCEQYGMPMVFSVTYAEDAEGYGLVSTVIPAGQRTPPSHRLIGHILAEPNLAMLLDFLMEGFDPDKGTGLLI